MNKTNKQLARQIACNYARYRSERLWINAEWPELTTKQSEKRIRKLRKYVYMRLRNIHQQQLEGCSGDLLAWILAAVKD